MGQPQSLSHIVFPRSRLHQQDSSRLSVQDWDSKAKGLLPSQKCFATCSTLQLTQHPAPAWLGTHGHWKMLWEAHLHGLVLKKNSLQRILRAAVQVAPAGMQVGQKKSRLRIPTCHSQAWTGNKQHAFCLAPGMGSVSKGRPLQES